MSELIEYIERDPSNKVSFVIDAKKLHPILNEFPRFFLLSLEADLQKIRR